VREPSQVGEAKPQPKVGLKQLLMVFLVSRISGKCFVITESSLDEYIIPAKSLQRNTDDMIIEKLTLSCRIYVSAKQKKTN